MHDLAPKIDPEFSDEAVAQPAAIIERIAELSKVLPASIIKRILRDVHYELTSAWKYFMALGKEKQVLVLVDGFTTLPLSLARNNAFVIVHGMLPDEIELFQDLAVKRGITNYSCIQDMTDLATKFDLIVSAATQPADSILYLKRLKLIGCCIRTPNSGSLPAINSALDMPSKPSGGYGKNRAEKAPKSSATTRTAFAFNSAIRGQF